MRAKDRRSVEEIQAAAREAAGQLEETVNELGLDGLIKALEVHFPEDMEPMSTDAACPSLAWDLHSHLAQVTEALGEAVSVMKRAASRKAGDVRRSWTARRLIAIEDPNVRLLLGSLFERLERPPA